MAAMVKKRRWCGCFKASWVDSSQREVEDVEALLVVVSDRRGMDHSGGAMARWRRYCGVFPFVLFTERGVRWEEEEEDGGAREEMV
jgi:hypothetical protein